MIFADFATILTSVKTATDIAKLLKETDVSLEKAEVKLKLADLIGALADVKMQFADVRELLLEKEERINALENELKLKINMVFETPYYWMESDTGRVGPFCPSCFDDKQKQARLIESTRGYWSCCICTKNFKDKNYAPQVIPRNFSKGIL